MITKDGYNVKVEANKPSRKALEDYAKTFFEVVSKNYPESEWERFGIYRKERYGKICR